MTLDNELTPSAYWAGCLKPRQIITIEYRKSSDRPREDDGWAVVNGSWVWDTKEKQFVLEPFSSNRTKAYLKRNRFSLKKAVEIANEILARPLANQN